jgi:hypothetical protein
MRSCCFVLNHSTALCSAIFNSNVHSFWEWQFNIRTAQKTRNLLHAEWPLSSEKALCPRELIGVTTLYQRPYSTYMYCTRTYPRETPTALSLHRFADVPESVNAVPGSERCSLQFISFTNLLCRHLISQPPLMLSFRFISGTRSGLRHTKCRFDQTFPSSREV